MSVRKVGSTYVLTWTLKDQNGARDLTGSTVTISMRDSKLGTMKITDAAVVLVSAAAGTCKYVVQAADVDTVATYQVMCKETRADGTKARYPSRGYVPMVLEETF